MDDPCVDSPVTNMHVGGSCEVGERQEEVTGPGNFRAVREIGQGAFGKVNAHCRSAIMRLSV